MSTKTQEGNEFHYIPGTLTLHREDGPAVIRHDIHSEYDYKTHKNIDTKVKVHIYFQNGIIHRSDGPAKIQIDKKTRKHIREDFYYHGEVIFAVNTADFKKKTKLKSFT